MSASKKKQQRREVVDTQKVSQAQAEQTAYKKKARTYTIIGVVVAVLVALLLIWNTGIFEKNAIAATVGNENLTVGEFSYYYYNNYDRYLYSYYGISDDTVYDSESGKTFGEYYLDSALNDAQRVIVIYNAAIAAGHTEAEVAENVDTQISSMKTTAASNGYSYKAYLKAAMGQYMTPSIYKEMITKKMLAELYYNEVGTADFDSYTTEDFEAYYTENADEVDTFTYSYLYFTPETVEETDAEGNELSEEEITALKEAAMAEAKAKAETALANYNKEITFTDLVETTQPTSSTDHTSVVGISSISSIYNEQLLELEPEEATLVENEGVGYYVVIFHSRERNADLTANVRHILVAANTTTDADGNVVAPTEEAWADALAEAEAILDEYKAGSMTAESFAELADRYSDDSAVGGLYENVAATDSYVPEFLDWIFDESGRVSGDTGLVRHEGDTSSSSSYWGYHVMYLDSWGESEWELDVRNALYNDSMTEWYDGLTENYAAALSDGTKHIIG